MVPSATVQFAVFAGRQKQRGKKKRKEKKKRNGWGWWDSNPTTLWMFLDWNHTRYQLRHSPIGWNTLASYCLNSNFWESPVKTKWYVICHYERGMPLLSFLHMCIVNYVWYDKFGTATNEIDWLNAWFVPCEQSRLVTGYFQCIFGCVWLFLVTCYW